MTDNQNQNYDTMLALALDLLSQSEAQHRAARRVETATDLLGVAIRQRRSLEAPAHALREALRGLTDILDAQRALLAEFDRELGEAAGT